MSIHSVSHVLHAKLLSPATLLKRFISLCETNMCVVKYTDSIDSKSGLGFKSFTILHWSNLLYESYLIDIWTHRNSAFVLFSAVFICMHLFSLCRRTPMHLCSFYVLKYCHVFHHVETLDLVTVSELSVSVCVREISLRPGEWSLCFWEGLAITFNTAQGIHTCFLTK